MTNICWNFTRLTQYPGKAPFKLLCFQVLWFKCIIISNISLLSLEIKFTLNYICSNYIILEHLTQYLALKRSINIDYFFFTVWIHKVKRKTESREQKFFKNHTTCREKNWHASKCLLCTSTMSSSWFLSPRVFSKELVFPFNYGRNQHIFKMPIPNVIHTAFPSILHFTS